MPNLSGQHLGQYEIIGVLGEGGMATVYRARQTSIGREVAVKVIKSDRSHLPDFIKRFEREATTVAALSHPHILKLFDYGEQGDLIYLVMEIMTGGSLDKLLRAEALPLPKVSRFLDQMAEALDYAHGEGVVHRDLKPQNVLLDRSNENAFLTDFGIAHLSGISSNLTVEGMVIGTAAYMSPEQGMGHPVDGRTDIYSLGIILYEMVTWRLPFVAATPAARIFQHVD